MAPTPINSWEKAPKVPEISRGTIYFTITGTVEVYNPTQIPCINLLMTSNGKFGIRVKQTIERETMFTSRMEFLIKPINLS